MAKNLRRRNPLAGQTDRDLMAHFSTVDRNATIPVRLRNGKRQGLATFFGKYGFNKGVEVGVQWGYFSAILCKANPRIVLSSIDPWMGRNAVDRPQDAPRNEQKFERATTRLAKYNCTIIRKKSLEAVHDFKDGSLDFVYIDGDHHFDMVIQDIIQWHSKLRKGGIMALHDYYHFNHGGVIPAVNAYTRSHHIDPWYVTYEDQPTAIWVKTGRYVV